MKGFEIAAPPTGYIIAFEEAFLKRYVWPEAMNEFSYLLTEAAPPAYLDPQTLEMFTDLAEQLVKAFAEKSQLRFRIVGSLLGILLLRIKAAFWPDWEPEQEASLDHGIVATFRRNLAHHFRDLAETAELSRWGVAQFARHQNLHPGYLSAVIRMKTGKSVQGWIAEKTVSASKALLARSSLSTKEVSGHLGFRDPAHFSRFFKVHTGQTPSEYARKIKRPQ